MLRPRRSLLSLSLAAFLLSLGDGATEPQTKLELEDDPLAVVSRDASIRRGRVVLESGSSAGALRIVAELALSYERASADSGREGGETIPGRLGVRVSGGGTEGRWAVTLVAGVLEEEDFVHFEILSGRAADNGSWTYLADLDLPVDLQDAAVVVERLDDGRWGAAIAELTEELDADRFQQQSVVLADRTKAPPAANTVAGPGSVAGEAPFEKIVELVPPPGRAHTGRVRFRAVVSTVQVARAVFFLDGKQAAVDESEPFSAVLDLGQPAARHTVRVEIFGPSGGRLGQDSVDLNAAVEPFRVAIRQVGETGSGGVRAVAEVSVPRGAELDRVEFYLGEALLTTLAGPPFEADMGRAGPNDFVRVVAILRSGETQEDARLVGGALSERIEVNLVEVFAVVTDRDGTPRRDLERDSFRLKRGRRQIPIESFGKAEDVPLVLGVMIDSSLSMWSQMVETRQAAAKFLADTLKAHDRAFLVDFDARPRLRHATTGDLGALLRSLGGLRAGGATAIYDSAIFSLMQFENEPGRRALVLLTDGRDFGSRVSAKHCLREAKRLGVPLYVIALSPSLNTPDPFHRPTRGFRSIDFQLEAFSRESGGRLFFIDRMEDLAAAYDSINAELRGQYLLTFSTDKPLEPSELGDIRVEVTDPKLKARTVVLDR